MVYLSKFDRLLIMQCLADCANICFATCTCTFGPSDAIAMREEEKRVDKAITRQLKEEKRQRKRDGVDRQLTVLVLGSRRSGKTTLIKLLKIMLHDNELSNARRRNRNEEFEISEEPFS